MSTTTSTIRERAPLLLVFGSLADRMAAILRARPSLTARIAFAPPEAMHAIAAFMYLAPEASASDQDVGDLIECTDPRDLLRMSLPECPVRLYRALDRAGSSARNREYYARLDAVCRGPFGSAFLDGDLNDTRLDYYEALPTMDALIVNMRGALPEVRHLAHAVDTLVALLRGYGAIDNCDLDLPRNARTGAVLRRLLRGLYAVRAPQPPFAVPEPFRLVETIGELRDLGREFKNCLANVVLYGTNHWLDLADGTAVYLIIEEPHLLTELRRVGPGLWHIDQLTGPKNAAPPFALRQSLEQKLRGAGIKLVEVSPGYAISNLDRAARPQKPEILNDVDDLEALMTEVNSRTSKGDMP
jgi:hypothetical protein